MTCSPNTVPFQLARACPINCPLNSTFASFTPQHRLRYATAGRLESPDRTCPLPNQSLTLSCFLFSRAKATLLRTSGLPQVRFTAASIRFSFTSGVQFSLSNHSFYWPACVTPALLRPTELCSFREHQVNRQKCHLYQHR